MQPFNCSSCHCKGTKSTGINRGNRRYVLHVHEGRQPGKSTLATYVCYTSV